MPLFDHYSEREQAILRRRAERVAQADQQAAGEGLVEVLQVRIGGEHYALPVEAVLAVYEHAAITPLPGVPAHIAGIVNLRGNLMVVLAPAALLNIPAGAQADYKSLVIVASADFSAALCVQDTGEVTVIDRNSLASPAVLMDGERAHGLAGILPDGTTLLNIAALLNDPALTVDQLTD